MATNNPRRSVQVERIGDGRFAVTNDRDGRIVIGTGEDADFTPTELLLAALAGCTAIDVDILTSRRAEPDRFVVTASGDKQRDAGGNRMSDLQVGFDVGFPEGAGGDAARTLLPDAVQRSHHRLCTVGRTVELGTPITTFVDGTPID